MAWRLLRQTIPNAMSFMFRLHARMMIFSSSKLSNRVSYRLNINVSDFHTLIVVDFKRFVYEARWAFDCNRFLRAFCALASTELWLYISSVIYWLFIKFCLVVSKTKEVTVVFAC